MVIGLRVIVEKQLFTGEVLLVFGLVLLPLGFTKLKTEQVLLKVSKETSLVLETVGIGKRRGSQKTPVVLETLEEQV